MQLKHIIILQNKIDLVKESAAVEQYKQIKKFVSGLLFFSLSSPFVYLFYLSILLFYLTILLLSSWRVKQNKKKFF